LGVIQELGTVFYIKIALGGVLQAPTSAIINPAFLESLPYRLRKVRVISFANTHSTSWRDSDVSRCLLMSI